ncbi:hypothetical protein DMUE_1846 [Dictyocoela muelleri]|nr:hypothetical protein DMUE_1846 [Dictyocoela muelleri]
MQFLQENDAIINLKEHLINLDSKEYEINDRITNFDEYDERITNKTIIFRLCENFIGFRELIKNMRNINPRIGLIPQYEHAIVLKCDFDYKFKEYSIPFRFRDEMEKHLVEFER